jgi:hypothetical protein
MRIDPLFSDDLLASPETETQLRDNDRLRCLNALPIEVLSLLKSRKCCVAGGFIRDTVAEINKPRDIDIFTVSQDHALVAAEFLKANAPFTRLNGRDKAILETGKALTIVGGYKEPVPQVIYRWVFDDMSKVIDAFDFTIAQAAIWYDAEQKRFVSRCSPTFYTDLEAQRLVYTKPRDNDALGTMLRTMKFYRDGYAINNENLAEVISELCHSLSRFGEGPDASHILTMLPNCGDGKY